MKIIQVSGQNFYAIKQIKLKLDDRGLLLVQGENLDDPSASSNGAGKSSILDLIRWVLYGETARGDSGDTVINDKEGKDCWGEVRLRDGEDIYYIIRYRKHTQYKNATYVLLFPKGDPKYVELHKATERETQEVITNQVLGCSREVFQAAVYLGQEQMPDLPGMTDKQLKLLIEEAAGTTLLSDAYSLALRRYNAADADAGLLNGRVAAANDGLKMARDDLASIQTQLDEFEKGRKARAAECVREMKAFAMAGAESEMKARVSHKAQLERSLASREAELASYAEKKKAVDQAGSDHNKAATAVSVANSQVLSETNRLKAMKAEFAALDDSIGKLCGECGKPHTAEDLKTVKLLHAKKIQEQRAHVAPITKKYEEALALKSELEKRHNELVAALPDVSLASAEARNLRLTLADIARHESDAVNARKEAAKCKELAREKLAEPNPHTATHGRLTDRVAKCDAEVAEVAAKLSEAYKAVEIAEAASKVYSPAGVRAHILDTVTPFLNDRTRDYLSTLSDGNIGAVWTTLSTTAKGELREKFAIEVTNDKGGKTFKSISGGEKRKVRLACAMALQDLVASRATKPIELFMADEIDDALDGAGMERLMTVLNVKAKERGTVLVISHNSLTDWIDQVITVTKKDGQAIVSGATG